jgi:purine-binding chemotaxis protein CheW
VALGRPLRERTADPMNRELHIVGFKLGRETYGVPITSLREIVRVPEITALPDAPVYVEGVINLRGKIVSVLDLRKRLGEVAVAPSKRNRILVVEHRGRLCGLIVDSASDVLKIPAKDVDPSPTEFVEGGLNCVTGLGKYQGRLIVLLDIDKVLEFSGSGLKDEVTNRGEQSASTAKPRVAAASK